jgi:hypothetical protein
MRARLIGKQSSGIAFTQSQVTGKSASANSSVLGVGGPDFLFFRNPVRGASAFGYSLIFI